MVPKRKKPTMALMQEDLPSIDPWAENAPALSRQPRRSGRNIRLTGMGSYPTSNSTYKEDTSSAGDDDKKENTSLGGGRAGVNAVMDNLKAMESNHRDTAKRQKLAVKASTVMAKEEDEDEAFKPQTLTSATQDLVRGDEVLPSPTEQNVVQVKRGKRVVEDIKVADLDNDAAQGPTEVDGEDFEVEDVNALKEAGSRPPPINSDYLPLPWKGRLGYACLNTYLRLSNPPVFSSRTCRIASILEHRHPLKDLSQPEHATKNRPDRDQLADIKRGQKYVEDIGLQNAKDIVKMLRWNQKYGIRFMRLSSEMFPFASHEEYGYKLAPFASEALAEAGRVAGELGHRLTTHPGQFTQLGSPRTEVVRNAIRDLEYHNELLTLLKLPEQQNKDAVMILHMGGVFGDKEATIQRFRENYAGLSEGIKARLVLENDDVCYTVHDLLPVCEELNIPMVLDYHHHNILFDKDKIREGTKDIMGLYPWIKATWDRKGITQKMHYSEPCPGAVTGRQRRKHRPRVMMLPPCADTMDLMIEAKDKEQSVFDLMRTYKLPGWDTINDIVPYERDDDNKPPPKPKTPKKKKKSKKGTDDDDDNGMVEPESEVKPPPVIPFDEVGMGGPNNRVYWPMGMEEWLRPKKREVKKKDLTEQTPKKGPKSSKGKKVKVEEDDMDEDEN